MILNKNIETFLIYVTFFSSELKPFINLTIKTQFALFFIKKVIIFAKFRFYRYFYKKISCNITDIA